MTHDGTVTVRRGRRRATSDPPSVTPFRQPPRQPAGPTMGTDGPRTAVRTRTARTRPGPAVGITLRIRPTRLTRPDDAPPPEPTIVTTPPDETETVLRAGRTCVSGVLAAQWYLRANHGKRLLSPARWEPRGPGPIGRDRPGVDDSEAYDAPAETNETAAVIDEGDVGDDTDAEPASAIHELGGYIRHQREAARLSLRKLAKQAGVSATRTSARSSADCASPPPRSCRPSRRRSRSPARPSTSRPGSSRSARAMRPSRMWSGATRT
jgi:hypothetical protein